MTEPTIPGFGELARSQEGTASPITDNETKQHMPKLLLSDLVIPNNGQSRNMEAHDTENNGENFMENSDIEKHFSGSYVWEPGDGDEADADKENGNQPLSAKDQEKSHNDQNLMEAIKEEQQGEIIICGNNEPQIDEPMEIDDTLPNSQPMTPEAPITSSPIFKLPSLPVTPDTSYVNRDVTRKKIEKFLKRLPKSQRSPYHTERVRIRRRVYMVDWQEGN